MTNERNLRGRDARDRMSALLGLGVPFPLRDLAYPGRIFLTGDTAARIDIKGAQAGVTYQLCDEEGEPVRGTQASSPVASGEPMVLEVPAVADDETYTILATRKVESLLLETHLAFPVRIRAGIDVSLPVEFEREGTRVPHRMVVSHGETVTVVVDNSQEGVTYRLISESLDGGKPLAPELKGDKKSLRFVCRMALTEDTRFVVQASAPEKGAKPLSQQLVAVVRPDPKVATRVTPPIVEFGTVTRVLIPSFQAGVRYELLALPVTSSGYEAPDPGVGVVEVQDGPRATITLRSPDRGIASSLPVVAEFSMSPEGMMAVSPPLNDDVFFLVRATKASTGETVLLDSVVAALVRPRRDLGVEVTPSPVAVGTEAWVIVTLGQPGVQYQLVRVADGLRIGVPGHPQTDRAVGTSRIDLDLLIEDDGPPDVWLPTGAMDRTTLFEVSAIRNATGVTSELIRQVTITVNPPQGSTVAPATRGVLRNFQKAPGVHSTPKGKGPAARPADGRPSIPTRLQKKAEAADTFPAAALVPVVVPRQGTSGRRGQKSAAKPASKVSRSADPAPLTKKKKGKRGESAPAPVPARPPRPTPPRVAKGKTSSKVRTPTVTARKTPVKKAQPVRPSKSSAVTPKPKTPAPRKPRRR